ncbi:MAG: hypothetical protein EXX96DRAFT_630717 [Benjaminiella poitrasii]|nr:MAG: hypothetical protein EXX96DRAFT_630717 [Benjaminiella poitrasii]
MKERSHTSQAKILLRSLSLPDDALTKLLTYIRTLSSRSQWYTLFKTSLWKTCHPELHSLDNKRFKKLQQFLQDDLNTPNNSTPLFLCRPTISINPILCRCIHWRLGWLPNGYSTYCPPLPAHPSQRLTRQHAIICLQMHCRLQMPETIEDSLSFLLNQLPTKKTISSHSVSPWHIRCPSICLILHELDQLQYNKSILPIPHPILVNVS